MRLTKVLLPEIFKGSRSCGSPSIDRSFKTLLDSFDFTSSGLHITAPSNTPEIRRHFNDPTFQSGFTLAKRALVEKWPNYYICRDFAEALADMRDRSIATDFLPEKFEGYIQFPDGMFNDAQGAYIRLGITDDRTTVIPENRGRWMFYCTYFGNIRDNGACYMARINFFKEEMHGLTVDELVQIHEPERNPETEERIRVAKLVINTLLYLNSQDPEILELRPMSNLSHRARKEAAKQVGGHVNLCTVPVKAINWDYKRVREYTDAETMVDTHLRWQRCGPGNSQIKLTWVKEHLRHYKKVLPEGEAE